MIQKIRNKITLKLAAFILLGGAAVVLLVYQPGVAVGDSPEGDGWTGGLRHADRDDVVVLLTLFLRRLAGAAVNIHLADQYLEAEICDPLHVCCNLGHRDDTVPSSQVRL